MKIRGLRNFTHRSPDPTLGKHMALLFDKDHQILEGAGLQYEECEQNRFLIIKNFPLKPDLYCGFRQDGPPINEVEVLWTVPPNYNTYGDAMFWVHPALFRADGKPIPNVSFLGGFDPRRFNGKEYCRWSRHWRKPGLWKPKVDNIQKVLDGIDWAFRNPNANK